MRPPMPRQMREIWSCVEENGPITAGAIREKLGIRGNGVYESLNNLERLSLVQKAGKTHAGQNGTPVVLWKAYSVTPHEGVYRAETDECRHCGRSGRRAHISGRMVCGWCFKGQV